MERKSDTVHKENFQLTEHGHNYRENDLENKDQDYECKYVCNCKVFPAELIVTCIINKTNCGISQHGHNVNTHRKTYNKEYQDDPSLTVCLVIFILPFSYQPDYKHNKHRGHRVNLALHGRKPKVSENVKQRAP